MNPHLSFQNMSPAKKTAIQAIILAIVLTAPLLFAQSGVGPAFLPAGHKQPATGRPSAASVQRDTAAQPQGFAGATRSLHAPADKAPSREVYATSTILRHGGSHTVLPPFAVIHVPAHLRERITRTPAGKYVPWPEFYNANRDWLLTHHVTIRQAEGKDPIVPGVRSQFTRINRMVVSVFQNHPISSLPAN